MAIRKKKGNGKSQKKQTNRGGTKKEYDGILFDSGLEIYCYKKLKEANIEAEYASITYEILPKIIYEGNDKKTNNVLAMKYTPDFVGDVFIIETKGWKQNGFDLRWKIFKHYLYNNNLNYQLYMPRNQEQVDLMIKKIKNEARITK